MSEIFISVEFYNAHEKVLFRGYYNFEQINRFMDDSISIKKSDLLSYMIFTEQRNVLGFSNYQELKNRVQHRLGDIDSYFTFNNNSVQSIFIGADMGNNFTERLGVGLGLSVLNILHNLTEADWKRIPEAPGPLGRPTFDFEFLLASDGINYILTESKGSTLENNQFKFPAISNHYTSIKRKKEHYINHEFNYNSNLHYGTIGVLDNRNDSIAKLWLVDPPSFNVRMDPNKYKLLARLHYYIDEFRNIGIRRRIINALEIRIAEIYSRQDYLKLDNVPLFENFIESERAYIENTKYFVSIDTNETFGRFFIIKNKQNPFIFILAFPKSIIRFIIRQNFNEILNYNYNPEFLNDNVSLLLRTSTNTIEEMNSLKNISFVFSEKSKGRYYEASYFGKVNYVSSGRIFGILDNEE